MSKFREIQLILSDINFDILSITETHLSEDVSNEWISINNYNLARKDRDRHGGGVLIYYKECLTINTVHKWDAHNIEAMWLNVTMRSQSFLIGCLYKPPHDTVFLDTFRELLTGIWLKRKNIVLIGDFNCELMPNSSNINGRRVKNIMQSFDLKNVISGPTRVTDHSESLLDLIITSQPSKVDKSSSIDIGISDHHLVYAVLRLARNKGKPKHNAPTSHKGEKRQNYDMSFKLKAIEHAAKKYKAMDMRAKEIDFSSAKKLKENLDNNIESFDGYSTQTQTVGDAANKDTNPSILKEDVSQFYKKLNQCETTASTLSFIIHYNGRWATKRPGPKQCHSENEENMEASYDTATEDDLLGKSEDNEQIPLYQMPSRTCPESLQYRARAKIRADEDFKNEIKQILNNAEQETVKAIMCFYEREIGRFNTEIKKRKRAKTAGTLNTKNCRDSPMMTLDLTIEGFPLNHKHLPAVSSSEFAVCGIVTLKIEVFSLFVHHGILSGKQDGGCKKVSIEVAVVASDRLQSAQSQGTLFAYARVTGILEAKKTWTMQSHLGTLEPILLKKTIARIQEAKWFSILVDEVTVGVVIEQLLIYIGYVDERGKPHFDFVEVKDCLATSDSANAETITRLIKEYRGHDITLP
ncbi:hypothetical protein AWC38_SpisGene7016 [Stylophora pistillata]|uniref:Endonuclease/exonuclease/phosphatase domain-containing protein n=1 Tax=Stylophora pistillata TaxID=50429 RepID=A0A2B4SEF4_STYPI|nr:hypothetical protein AWC38_SpisGene7016 [Stylophora pistillata]